MTPILPAAALLAAIALPAAAPAIAQVSSERQFRSLEVVVETVAGIEKFGKIGDFMNRLKKAGRSCALDRTWAYGVNIKCVRTDKDRDVYMALPFAPTRSPEMLDVSSIRARGVDGGELPKSEFVDFLRSFLKPAEKPAAR